MYLHQRWVQRWRTPSPWFTLANAKACPSSKSSRASTAPASAVDMTRSLGVSDAVVGLTIVAIGTSAPKLATTIMDTPKNERDIAIGNLIGSSTYNILFILGVTCLATPSRVPVDTSLLHVDLPLAALRWWRCCACPSSSPTGASRAWRALCLSRLTRCTWAR